jgi:hypothetical protein
MLLSSDVMNALMLAVSWFLFVTTMSRRSRLMNVIVGSVLIICSVLAAVLGIRAYQLSY